MTQQWNRFPIPERPVVRLTIWGNPRTKKNSGEFIVHQGRKKLLPSKAWRRWRDGCVVQMQSSYTGPIIWPVNCEARFYGDRHIKQADAVGMYQGLADLLEVKGIVDDDKRIVAWDGSRLYVAEGEPTCVVVNLTPTQDHRTGETYLRPEEQITYDDIVTDVP